LWKFAFWRIGASKKALKSVAEEADVGPKTKLPREMVFNLEEELS